MQSFLCIRVWEEDGNSRLTALQSNLWTLQATDPLPGYINFAAIKNLEIL
jgi:hypothetical protein